MAVTTVISSAEQPEALLDGVDAVMRELEKRAHDVRGLRARRARTARERIPAVSKSVEFTIAPGEDASAACREAAEAILLIVDEEADGDQWKGEIELLGDTAANGRARVLARVKIDLHGGTPTPKPTRDSELTGVIGAMRQTINDLGKQVVEIAKTKVQMGKAEAKMVRRMAKYNGRATKNDRKWKWKMHREEQKTERAREEALERAARSRHRWEAFESIGVEYKDVFEIWSKWYTEGTAPGRRGGKRTVPQRPTRKELDAVFRDGVDKLAVDGRPFSEVFDPLHAIVSEMIEHPDVQARIALAKRARDFLEGAEGKDGKRRGGLNEAGQNALRMRMLAVLGIDRCREVAAWISLPVS